MTLARLIMKGLTSLVPASAEAANINAADAQYTEPIKETTARLHEARDETVISFAQVETPKVRQDAVPDGSLGQAFSSKGTSLVSQFRTAPSRRQSSALVFGATWLSS